MKEIVINANPKAVPYSLRALKTLWMNRLHVNTKTFKHSNIDVLPPFVLAFNESLEWTLTENVEQPSVPQLDVVLIWKNVQHTEMISAATNYIPIIGEVNILRFLSRVGPSEYLTPEYPLEESVAADAVLDIVAQFNLAKDTKARQALWTQLAFLLGKKSLFGNNLLTIADVAVSSVVKQFTRDSIPPTLLQHLKYVNGIVGYEQKDFH